MIARLRRCRDTRRRRGQDAGLSLVEILIALTLSLILGAVLVAGIVTSLNVAGSTNDTLKTAIDVRLISSYLARDAQGASGTNPQTALSESRALVSLKSGDWGGCTQSGNLVARFSWVDHVTAATERTVTVTWALSNSVLTRKYCENGNAVSSIALGSTVSSASATCSPAPADCSGIPTSISLTINGTTKNSSYTNTFSASFRSRTQDVPGESNSSAVPLLTLGDCPNLTVGATSTANVIGDAVLGAGCTPPVTGTLNVLGLFPKLVAPTDPFVTRTNPCATLPTARTYTDVDGTIQPGTYSAQITMTKNVTFAPGVYCFTSTSTPALTVGAAARLSGKGVTIYLASGGLTVSPGATINLLAPTTGNTSNIVVWLPKTNTKPVSISSGSLINILGGYVYAPASAVTVTGAASTSPVNVGGVIAKTAVVSNYVLGRFGRVPDVSITPSSLPDGRAGRAYSQALSVTNLGSGVTWSQTGLTGGLSLDSAGKITGTPSCWGSSTVTVTAQDSTGLGTWANLPLTVTPGISLADPGSDAFDYVYLDADAPAACTGGTSLVTFQYAPTGTSSWLAIPGCSAVASPFLCTWDTLAKDLSGNLVFTNKAAYDIRAVIDTTSYYSETYTMTVDNIIGGDIQTKTGTTNPGKLDSGDVIELSFTDQVKPSRIISGWNGSARKIYFRISAGDIFKTGVPSAFAACQKNSCGVFFASSPNDCTDTATDADRVWDPPSVNLGVIQAASGNTFPNGGQSMWLMEATLRLESDAKTLTITLGSTLCTYWSKAGAGTSAAYKMIWYPLINHASVTVGETGTLDIDF